MGLEEVREDRTFEGAAVLVTGGCGFIGSHLVESLVQDGAQVTVYDNLQAGKWSNLASVADRIEQIEGDVRDAEAMAKVVARTQPQFVFHLAANASVPLSVQDPVYDFETNSSGTFVVLNALRGIESKARVVAASSGAVYGEPVSFPIREEDALRPISPYGASKLNTEITSQMFHRVYGSEVVLARIFNAYGPRMARFVLLDFLKKLQKDGDRLEILGTGQQIRDFTYVADTVAGLKILALRGKAGEGYNISSGRNYSVTELAHHLIAQVGLTGRTRIEYTGKSWVGDAQRWEVSIEKLATLGYASQDSLESGLKKTIAWFRSVYGAVPANTPQSLSDNPITGHEVKTA